MPNTIRVTINRLKATLPLKNVDSTQDLLYNDEILMLSLNKFVVTVQVNKTDDAVILYYFVGFLILLELSPEIHDQLFNSCRRISLKD